MQWLVKKRIARMLGGSAADLLVNRLPPAPQAKAPKVIQNQLSVMQ